MQCVGLASKKKNPYFGFVPGIWRIHLGGGEGKRLSLDILLLELMLWIVPGITATHWVRMPCEYTFFMSALTGASWGGLEPGWISSHCRAGLFYIGWFHLQSLFVWLASGSACTHSAILVQPFCHSSSPFHPLFFFPLNCHKCPQGVGHEICADWRDPEGNFSASR